jgi:outer membrane protein assembly factor BamE (lipoprotein component of BamABCDE complex)
MKTTLRSLSLLRTATLITAFTALSALASAAEISATDSAARILVSNGFVSVQNAGPYVERGTFRIQVSTKLGRPSLALSDGTWLYHGRTVEGSSARGTLIVRFNNGRVVDLAIATPAVVAALQADPRKPLNAELVASK